MYTCNCGKQFEKQSSLNSHARFCNLYVKKEKPSSKYKLHENLYECECGKHFDNYQSLNGHFSYCLIHRKGKPFANRSQKGWSGWCKGKTYEEYLGKKRADEYKNTISSSLKKWHKEIGFSEETRNNFSKKQKLYLENNHHIKWFEVFNGEKNIKVQGKWEYDVALWLNKQNIRWDRKTLIYDTYRRYTPDFYLTNLNEYLEVKGWLRECDKEKMNKIIKEQNIKIKMLYKEDYKQLNEINIGSLKYF
jgi:hypothetical protein